MILLLGGTSEARELARLLHRDGRRFTSSLAGRVAEPRLPAGEVRVGGFGGAPGLRRYLRSECVSRVVDATHPFAQGMSANAVAACANEGISLLRLERPGWSGLPEASRWHWVADHDDAARTAAGLGGRPFLTVGRQSLDRFLTPLADHRVLVRVVDTPEVPVPAPWRLLLSRGPYSVEGERRLMTEHGADVVVTKDAGGDYTWGKMQAAAELEVPVVVVRRGPGNPGVPVVNDVPEALAWVDGVT